MDVNKITIYFKFATDFLSTSFTKNINKTINGFEKKKDEWFYFLLTLKISNLSFRLVHHSMEW